MRAMRPKFRSVRLTCLLVLVLALNVGTLPSDAEQSLPLDYKAIFKTHVPHVNSPISRGGEPSSQAIQPTAAAQFLGSAYVTFPTVAPTTTVPEAEEHVAVDPNNANALVAAVSDFALGGFNTTKYVFSLDNGASWVESYVPLDPFLGFLATGDGFFWLANSDPVVAIDKRGNVYLANLYLDVFDNGNGLYISVATQGPGVNFTVAATYPIATNPDALTNVQEDKPWIAVDNSNVPATTGNVYACWTRFVGTSDSIVFSRSLDQGARWASPIQISLASQNGAVQGCQVAVGPSGEVYVVYEVFYVGGRRQHFLAKSVGGGLTFSTPRAITPLFKEISFNSTYRKNSFASLAVSPLDGNVYVVYADQPSKTLGAEVEFIMSTDGGATFSAPRVINDKSVGQQFMSAVTVDSTGVIHVSWFDTRNSSGTTSLYDIYATYSKNKGDTFAVNARVTGSLVNAGRASFIGDYAGIAASGRYAHPVWTSGGFNNGILQTAVLQLP